MVANPDSWPCARSFKFASSTPSPEEDAEVFVSPVLLNSAEVQWWNRFSKIWTTMVGVVQCLLKRRYRYLALPDLIDKAENVLFRIIQFECFCEEYAYIKAEKPVKTSSCLMQFQPFLDAHGIIRVKCRLQ